MRDLVTYIYLWIFGISAWIAVNGVQNQLWRLVTQLEEGEDIAPRITILTQVGNLIPLLYVVLRYTSFLSRTGKFLRKFVSSKEPASRAAEVSRHGNANREDGILVIDGMIADGQEGAILTANPADAGVNERNDLRSAPATSSVPDADSTRGAVGVGIGGTPARRLSHDDADHTTRLRGEQSRRDALILSRIICVALVVNLGGFTWLALAWRIQAGGIALGLYSGFAVLSGMCCLSTLTYWPWLGFVCDARSARASGAAASSEQAGDHDHAHVSQASKEKHVARGASALAAGEACGMLVIALSNSFEKIVEFSPSVFFLILASVNLLSFLAFLRLRAFVFSGFQQRLEQGGSGSDDNFLLLPLPHVTRHAVGVGEGAVDAEVDALECSVDAGQERQRRAASITRAAVVSTTSSDCSSTTTEASNISSHRVPLLDDDSRSPGRKDPRGSSNNPSKIASCPSDVSTVLDGTTISASSTSTIPTANSSCSSDTTRSCVAGTGRVGTFSSPAAVSLELAAPSGAPSTTPTTPAASTADTEHGALLRPVLWTTLWACNAAQSGLIPSLTVFACKTLTGSKDSTLYFTVSTLPGYIGPVVSIIAGVTWSNLPLLLVGNLAWMAASVCTLVLACCVAARGIGPDGSAGGYGEGLRTTYCVIQTIGVGLIFYAKPATLAWLGGKNLSLAGAVLQSAQLVGSVGFFLVAVVWAED